MSKTSTEKTINGLTAINGKVFACKVPTEQFAYLDGMLHLLTTEEKWTKRQDFKTLSNL